MKGLSFDVLGDTVFSLTRFLASPDPGPALVLYTFILKCDSASVWRICHLRMDGCTSGNTEYHYLSPSSIPCLVFNLFFLKTSLSPVLYGKMCISSFEALHRKPNLFSFSKIGLLSVNSYIALFTLITKMCESAVDSCRVIGHQWWLLLITPRPLSICCACKPSCNMWWQPLSELLNLQSL